MESGNEAFGSSEAGKLGGKARAKKLSKVERSEIARKAAESRWEKQGLLKSKVLKATHGDPTRPLRIGELQIPCYVLEDGTRALSGRGMQEALALGQGHGALLASFLESKSIKSLIRHDLAMALANPIRFVRPGRGGKLAVGYEATILADICDLVLEARKEGKLNARENAIAQQCEILTRAFAKVGIIALVDEATGYQDDRPRQALAKILEAFIAKELRRWVKTFPMEYYTEMYRLRGLPYPTNGNKMPQYFGMFTNDVVYSRLAPGVLEELKRKNPTNDQGRRKHKQFQLLTQDVGHPKLLQHLGAVVALMRTQDDGNWDGFMKLLNKLYPKQLAMPLFEQKGPNARPFAE